MAEQAQKNKQLSDYEYHKTDLGVLYNHDCLEIMKQLGNDIIDLTVTSPPYDDLRNYNGYSFDFENIAQELYRITKPGGIVVWVVGDSIINGSESGTSFRQALYFKEIGFNLHDTMIYRKNGSSFPARKDGNRYSQIFEYMFILSKDKPSIVNLICDKLNVWFGHTNWGDATNRDNAGNLIKRNKKKPVPRYSPRDNIWEYVTGKGFSSSDDIAFEHPAIFPEKLAQDHILSWSKEKDMVLDIFNGSGTTSIMAEKNNRNWIGIELSKDYCDIAVKRIETERSQRKLF